MKSYDIAIIAHRTPRRIRLLVPSRRGDDRHLRTLAARLAQLSGVAYARHNATTGSITIAWIMPVEVQTVDLAPVGLLLADEPVRTAPISSQLPAKLVAELALLLLTGHPLAALVRHVTEDIARSLVTQWVMQLPETGWQPADPLTSLFAGRSG